MTTRPRLWSIIALAAVASASTDPGVPNDPHFDRQWGLYNTGQTIENQRGLSGADVRAVDGWDIHPGARPVIVAIVGRGVDPHVEFEDRLLEGFASLGDERNSLAECGGDTHLAGVIAAETKNAFGIAGLNSAVTILPVRVTDGCLATLESTSQGIVWAVDNGADIVLAAVRHTRNSAILDVAVAHAYDHDVLMIAPLGSDGNGTIVYPAALPGCMAIAATTNLDTVSASSNFTNEVDLAAPGQDVWSTLANDRFGSLPSDRDTAVAAAHVAGAASLIRSYAPQVSAVEMAQVIVNSADDLVLRDGMWTPVMGD